MDLSKLKCFHVEKPKRKSVNRQIKESKNELIKDILSKLRDERRKYPKDWERGFNAAMSIVARFEDD